MHRVFDRVYTTIQPNRAKFLCRSNTELNKVSKSVQWNYYRTFIEI